MQTLKYSNIFSTIRCNFTDGGLGISRYSITGHSYEVIPFSEFSSGFKIRTTFHERFFIKGIFLFLVGFILLIVFQSSNSPVLFFLLSFVCLLLVIPSIRTSICIIGSEKIITCELPLRFYKTKLKDFHEKLTEAVEEEEFMKYFVEGPRKEMFRKEYQEIFSLYRKGVYSKEMFIFNKQFLYQNFYSKSADSGMQWN